VSRVGLASALLVLVGTVGLGQFLARLAGELQKRSAEPLMPKGQQPPLLPRLTTKLPAAREFAELRGVWLYVDEIPDWDELMGALKRRGFNAVFLRVARGGHAVYPSRNLPQEPWAREKSVDHLQLALRAARSQGLQLHAWKVCFHLGTLRRSTDPEAQRFYRSLVDDQRLARDGQGRFAEFLNPADPRNQALELAVAQELLSRYDVDGYHLDYIRYPDQPSFDFDYSSNSRQLFERSIGRKLVAWPQEVREGLWHATYTQWQREVITNLVRHISHVLKSTRPQALLSAAVWRRTGLHCATVKQDWPQWAHQQLVDFLVLMNYERDPARFHAELDEAIYRVGGSVPIMAGIGAYQLSPEEVLKQIAISRQLGSHGFVLLPNRLSGEQSLLETVGRFLEHQPAMPGLGPAGIRFEAIAGIQTPSQGPWIRLSSQPARVGVRVGRWLQTQSELVAEVEVVDQAGRRLAGPQTLPLAQDREIRVTIGAWTQPVRIVVRGRTADRPDVLLYRHSPWIFPVDSDDWLARISRQRPPVFLTTKTHAAVYAESPRAEAALAEFGALPHWEVMPIYQLSASHLRDVQVLVLLPYSDLRDASPGSVELLRNWVHEGGCLVVLGSAIGRGPYPPLFPEIAVGKALRCRPTTVTLTTAQGVVGKFPHQCEGHVPLKVGSLGHVLAWDDQAQEALAVGGTFGRGVVYLVGLLPNPSSTSPDGPGGFSFLRFLLDAVARGRPLQAEAARPSKDRSRR
jgi:uncharacterized lipoprotein YddW (UPF0748 family)